MAQKNAFVLVPVVYEADLLAQTDGPKVEYELIQGRNVKTLAGTQEESFPAREATFPLRRMR